MKLRRFEVNNWRWNRDTGDDEGVLTAVGEILSSVRRGGDAALRDYTKTFDGFGAANAAEGEKWDLRVPADVLQHAWLELPDELQSALQAAAQRIRAFHQAQETRDVSFVDEDGARLGLTWRPLRRVGVYAPGGQAAYPSTVLMDVIPAQAAGVEEIALVSPPTKATGLPHQLILAAAHLVGVTEVYRVGGAQAIGALAYGTESIPGVDKVVGPGNIYVATAKRLVAGTVGIDSIAGPSEVFIVADDTANPAYIAADMLAQAEHDAEAGAVCVVPSATMADAVEMALNQQLEALPRRAVCEKALDAWGAVIIADNLDDAIRVVNQSAPEHVELLVGNATEWLGKIRTAGAVFLGPYSPEPVGDYYAGTNHVLPTHGSGRFASGLGVHDFLRRMSYVEYQRETLFKHSQHITTLARAEGLTAHAKSIEVRVKGRDDA